MRSHQQQSAPVDYYPVATSTVIEIGDLVATASNLAVPLSDLADQGTEGDNQVAAAAAFVGRAVGRRTGTEAAAGEIAVTCDIVKYPCASTTWVKGDLVGPVEAASGTELEDQKVAKVTDPLNAIGRCHEGGTNLTEVWVQLINPKAGLVTTAQAVADT